MKKKKRRINKENVASLIFIMLFFIFFIITIYIYNEKTTKQAEAFRKCIQQYEKIEKGMNECIN